MRGKARRTWTAGLATVALTAGLAACTGGSGDGDKDSSSDKASAKPVAQACANGTFTWAGVKKSDTLTGVSDVESLGDGVTTTGQMERVYTPRASVKTQGPALSPAEVLFSLGKKIGEIDSEARTLAADGSGDTWAFTDVNGKAPALDSGTWRADDAGEFVTYAGVREVTADFQYSCPDGKATTGQARQWTVDIGGVLSCDEAVDTDLARQAARRSCEEGAAATRDAA